MKFLLKKEGSAIAEPSFAFLDYMVGAAICRPF